MFLITSRLANSPIKSTSFVIILKRFKSNKPISSPSSRALKHFDGFYKSVFSDKWPSVRLALLSKQKEVAVVNNFGEVEDTEKLLVSEGALNLRSFLDILKQGHLKNKNVSPPPGRQAESKLSDVITAKFEEEEENDLNRIYPKGKEFQARVLNQEAHEVIEKDYNYDIDSAPSSLHSDLADSKIDTNRLILPNSNANEGLLYNFVPATQLRGLEGFIAESEYYKYYEAKSRIEIKIEEECELDFPEFLKVYSFDRGDVTDFPDPAICVNNVYNFVTVDGGEFLAALALGVKPEDHVLDMCSASGNIAYCVFQSLRPKILVCPRNDNTERLYKDSLYNYSAAWKDMLLLTDCPVDDERDQDLYDKILVEVNSTNDKHSVLSDERNFFEIKNLKERLSLPQTQAEMLVRALKIVRPGGAVLYSTSTLSPLQNDGVVNEALRVVHESTNMKFTVKNLSPALAHTSLLFNFGDYLKLKFGTLVVPFVPTNFGPRYFCKIVKNE